MASSFFLSEEDACTVNYDGSFGPIASLDILVVSDSDFMAIDHDAILPLLYFVLKAEMCAIMDELIDEIVSVYERIIDSTDLKRCFVLNGSPDN